MRLLPIPLALLLLALPLAGCLESPSTPTQTASGSSPEPVAPTAGGTIPGSLKEQIATVPPDAAIPFAVDGRTGQLACAAAVCHVFSPDTGGYHDPAHPRARTVTATLTWTAETPATQQMVMGVYRVTSDCGENCTDVDFELVEEVRGPSPLTLDVTGLSDKVAVRVSYGHSQPGLPVYVRPVDQAYRLTGLLTPAQPI